MKDYVDALLEDYLGEPRTQEEVDEMFDLPEEPTLPGEDGDE